MDQTGKNKRERKKERKEKGKGGTILVFFGWREYYIGNCLQRCWKGWTKKEGSQRANRMQDWYTGSEAASAPGWTLGGCVCWCIIGELLLLFWNPERCCLSLGCWTQESLHNPLFLQLLSTTSNSCHSVAGRSRKLLSFLCLLTSSHCLLWAAIIPTESPLQEAQKL